MANFLSIVLILCIPAGLILTPSEMAGISAREMNYLKVYAYRIRRKLGDEGGQILQSDPSVGYRLMPPGP